MTFQISKFLFHTSFFLLAVVIVTSPLLLGSNRYLPWLFNAGLVGCAFAFWGMSRLLSSPPFALPARRVAYPFLVLLLCLLWAIIQWLPLDTPFSNPIWDYAQTLLKQDLAGRITASSSLTALSLLRILTYVAFAWLLLQYCASSNKAFQLLVIFVLTSSTYALYGLWALTQGHDTILWMGERPNVTSLSATFVNRNNAATYFGLGSVACLMLLYQSYRQLFTYGRPRQGLSDWVISLLASRVGGFLICFVLLLGSTLLTNSRAGILVTLIALGFALIAITMVTQSKQSANQPPRRFTRIFLNLFAILAIAAFAIFELSGAGVEQRLFQSGMGDINRWNVYRICLQILGDYPWTGVGLGGFPIMFELYKDETISNALVWDKAHNSYLELFLGLGIPFALLFLSAFVWAILRCIQGLITRQRHRYFLVIALAATLLVGLHALVDFSMEIQAVALAYLVLLCAGVGQSWSSRSRR